MPRTCVRILCVLVTGVLGLAVDSVPALSQQRIVPDTSCDSFTRLASILLLWGVLLVASVASTSQAQAVALPTAAQCDSAAALARSDPRTFFTDSPISSCGLRGARAIAAVLPRMSTEQDAWLLGAVAATSGIRDASIFAAAIALTRNSAATSESRFAAIQVLAQQELGSGAGVMPSSGASGLSGFADTTVLCAVVTGDTTIVSGDPLPRNHLAQTTATTGALAQNPTVTPALRRAARCLRNRFSPPLLPPIEASRIHGSYVCDTRFKVVNTTPVTLELGFEIRGVESRRTFMAAAGRETVFSTGHYGTVTLSYGDQLLQSIGNDHMRCGQAPRGRDSDRKVLERLARTSGCRTFGFRIGHGPGVSLSKKDQCTLATAAFAYVAADGAQAAGLSAPDSAKIESASIYSFAFDDISGGPGESYWTVEFQIADRSYDIVVRIDRRTGSVSAGRGHKATPSR